jgi:hypothetical protein
MKKTWDYDGDGLPDGWEVDNALDPLSASGDDGAGGDPDDDGLTNLQEYQRGTNPFRKDTDYDGLEDGAEVNVHGTSPLLTDTDGDGMADGWEVRHGFDPLVNNDTDGIQGNGAGDDPDDDGLLNFDEYLNGSDPSNGDTDGDGVWDSAEVAQGSDPADASDNGQPPPPEDILELPFRIYGDWAAWEMTVEGRGPSDLRVFKLSTDAPGGSATAVRKLHKGNSYRLTMSWLGSGTHTDPYWYCWEAKIGGLPTQQAYGNPSSVDTAVRIPGAATTVAGEGWFADNADGLLTSHVHSNDDGSGNVAEGLEAILYVPKIVTETVATSPPDRARKTIGVGEEVKLSLAPALPSSIVPTWTRDGDGDLRGTTGLANLFTAPDRNATTTITANFGSGASCSTVFQTIEPSDVVFENNVIVVAFAHPSQNFYSIKGLSVNNHHFVEYNHTRSQLQQCEI